MTGDFGIWKHLKTQIPKSLKLGQLNLITVIVLKYNSIALLCSNASKGCNFNLNNVYRDQTSSEGGGRVVRWPWVNFQCRGVLQFG